MDYGVLKGWNSIVAPLVEFVESNGGTVVQIKEKFGALRFYYEEPENADREVWDEFERMLFEAEKKSEVTCEYTGEPGTIRRVNGWFKCVSDETYQKLTSRVEEYTNVE